MKKTTNSSIRILGVDIGTTGCKCIVFDESFNSLAEGFYEYPLIHRDSGEVEQNPGEWWEAVVFTIRDTVGKSSGYGPVKAIGISSQGITFVPVDEKGIPLMNAVTWLDKRAVDECNNLISRLGLSDIYHITGKRSNPVYTLPKLIWLKKNNPEIYQKTYKFLMTHDFIINRLCGAFVTEHSLAAGTMAYDINTKSWSKKILDAAGISRDKLPGIKESGVTIGKLGNEAAEKLGLDPGIVISTGGQDQKCAAYGAGLTGKDITVSLGTSSAITALYDRPVFTDEMSLPCFPYIDGEKWVLEGFSSTAGGAVKWFRNNIAPGKSYKEIDKLIEEAYADGPVSGNVSFFPHLAGTSSPEWYESDGGGFQGITLNTNSTQMAAAVLESAAFIIRANIEKIESIGNKIDSITVFGGGANSRIWLKIIADATNKTVKVPLMEETACLGAALKAGTACGAVDIGDTDGYFKIIKKEQYASYGPEKINVKLFNKKYKEYKKLERKIYGG